MDRTAVVGGEHDIVGKTVTDDTNCRDDTDGKIAVVGKVAKLCD